MAGRPPVGVPATSGSCSIWSASTFIPTSTIIGLLDPSERARREQLRRPEDRQRFTIGAALLRVVVGAELQVSPASVPVSRSCRTCGRPHGRPTITESDLHVSVAHSGACVLVAVTPVGPVGVDVEQVTELDAASLWRSVSGPGEPFPLATLRDFFVLWTRKEAVLKATGDGLSVPMTDLIMTSPSDPPEVLHYPGLTTTEFQVVDVSLQEEYCAAAAVVSAATVAIVQRRGDELLTRPE